AEAGQLSQADIEAKAIAYAQARGFQGAPTSIQSKRLILKSFLRCQQASCEPFYAVEMCDFRLKRTVPQRSCLPKMLVFLGKLLLRNSLLEAINRQIVLCALRKSTTCTSLRSLPQLHPAMNNPLVARMDPQFHLAEY